MDRNSEQVELSALVDNNQRVHKLYENARKDMETLERLIGAKNDQIDGQNESN